MKQIQAPKATKNPMFLEKHNDVRIDNYFWLNQRDSPEVLAYLNAENQYFEQVFQPIKPLEETLFLEMKTRIKQDDTSVPYRSNGYWYQTRFEQNKEYPIYVRWKDDSEKKEEILFDVNEMAKGFSYYKIGEIEISPDNKWGAFSVDTKGRRMYTLFFKNLLTGEILSSEIKNVSSFCWASDNKTIFYSVMNKKTLRTEKIMRHQLGATLEKDTLIFFEKDTSFDVSVYRSKSGEYIIIDSESTTTTECQFLKSDNPLGKFTIFQKRIKGLEYSISHYEDHFYILNNHQNSFNFKLDKTSVNTTNIEFWKEVIPHREDTLLEDFDIFKNYLVLGERNNGLNKIRIVSWNGEKDEYLPFDNETYTVFTANNHEFDTEILRYYYNSLTTPSSVIDYNMRTKTKEIKKEQEILGENFDKNEYISERIWAKAADGTEVPISLVYKKGMRKNGENPLLLYGYGSYGITIDPSFSTNRLSLLNRGFIFAIAHIRGGEYLGRNWYENGKMLLKKNTFTDFISCAETLIKQNYTSKKHLYAMGGSAGGLLMGAVMNMAPKLFNGMIAQVPFVDVITTMLDDSIPLTTGEYEEWGNPNDLEYYQYMKSYSPYDNVQSQNYPNLLITTGYHDSQVQYWEPAKWVAKLRELKTDENILLFHTNMSAGHSGASGRFEALKETAREYAFLLFLEGYK